MQTPDPEPSIPEPALDADAEAKRLDELGERIEATRQKAHEDLDEPGGAGRTFADEGVRAQVESTGDTHHPPADRP